MELTPDDLARPPLPAGPLLDGWRAYLAAWSAGRRREALTAVSAFVGLLEAADPDVWAAYARWLCSSLFDRSTFWAGQWGGGLVRRDGRWQRPAAPALTVHPLSVRVLLPYLLAERGAGPAHDGDPRPRWLYQFAVGQAFRLPPGERERLRAAVEERCGPGAPTIALLRLATGDPVARRMLRDAKAPD